MMTSSTPSSTVPDAGQVQSDPDTHRAPETAAPAEGSDATAEAAGETTQVKEELTEERWRRALADLDNARKRATRELSHVRDSERALVARQFLPVVDNLELALAHADDAPGAVIEGIRAVRDQAVAVLARLGYERFDKPGVPFDPTVHEVVSVVEDPNAEPGTVVQVLRPGYGDAERQLRPAGVAVSRPRK
ncbi:MAG: molecular chaperone GrpE [Frankiales bacterium]|jgi:molecular chaperone GrpE|nr:molecular chaperone GrpE [Frankiales bacterium]